MFTYCSLQTERISFLKPLQKNFYKISEQFGFLSIYSTAHQLMPSTFMINSLSNTFTMDLITVSMQLHSQLLVSRGIDDVQLSHLIYKLLNLKVPTAYFVNIFRYPYAKHSVAYNMLISFPLIALSILEYHSVRNLYKA